ncbi:Ribose import ATP-binding protein RbsA [Agrobacterium sp. DSM 25558]|uniref:ABC transporter ATP-binding protein n=1 Tax=Agrobacterium sp. DSM 25558 TaxID=1907665 RepID=UPI00097245F7|nr:ABC transporter ATP-binding protein [Agrobacterium sp. DSM 25558]SCX30109.1 Ribose import ATP-binding protein RbsA [Agrobacterium sp. DSM 25558]
MSALQVNTPATDSASPYATAAAVEFRDISKSYGQVKANHLVSFTVPLGTIHGVVGENGAGKSTLMRILAGSARPDTGTLLINGKPVVFRTPKDSHDLKIGMVHQHFMLVDQFTVLENLLLSGRRGAWLPNHTAEIRSRLAYFRTVYQLDVDPDAVVADLSVGSKQRVEIVKALLGGARILILDEPTAVLTPQEADQLFEILKILRAEGVTTLLVTHKLREIKLLTESVTVMRRGTVVANRVTSTVTEAELAELMIGRVLRDWSVPPLPTLDDVRLNVSDLTVRDRKGSVRVDKVSFNVRAGEIVGIAGIDGNGQSELLEALTGTLPVEHGTIDVHGEAVSCRSLASTFRQLGIAVVPADRLKDGVVSDFTASWNAVLGYVDDEDLGFGPALLPGPVKKRCQDLMDDFEVKPANPDIIFSHFSGGNQQKLVIAREVSRSPKILIVGQPTRGVDVGTIELIHARILDVRRRGGAVILVSVETDEILKLSDRIVVMCAGKVTGELLREQATERQLGILMSNARVHETGEQP